MPAKSTLETVSTEFLQFWQERHLCTLTTVRADGTPHVVPVGATLDVAANLARVITSRRSYKARRITAAEGAHVALCQVEHRRWSTVEGFAVAREDADSVAEAERRYAARYKPPRPSDHRVVLEISITRVLGNV